MSRREERDPRLDALLDGLTPVARESATWPSGDAFELSSYFTTVLPPADLIMSVRAVVVRDGAILTFEDDAGPHIVPGGRVEPGEAALDTLARELREEVGCEIAGEATLMGFLHLHHMGPRRPEYIYAYPDNFQLIYLVRMATEPRAREEEPLVLEPRFVAPEEVAKLDLPAWERAFLDHPLLKS